MFELAVQRMLADVASRRGWPSSNCCSIGLMSIRALDAQFQASWAL